MLYYAPVVDIRMHICTRQVYISFTAIISYCFTAYVLKKYYYIVKYFNFIINESNYMSESSKLSAIDKLREEFPGAELPPKREKIVTEIVASGEKPRLEYTKNKRSQSTKNNSCNNVVTIKDNDNDVKYTMSISVSAVGPEDFDFGPINDNQLAKLQALVDEFVSKVHEVL